MMRALRSFMLLVAALISVALQAKSLVITLNDARQTKVYYKLTTEQPPRMVIADDGTFLLNGQEYSFDNVKNFFISSDDYSGKPGTKDGIVTVKGDLFEMKGEVNVYALDGQLIRTSAGKADMNGLQPGVYVISNGVSTIKIQKR